MELKELKGNIIGIISNDGAKGKIKDIKVSEFITFRIDDSLKMVGIEEDIKDKLLSELSTRDLNKVILASKLHDKEIILYDFSKGLTKKDLDFFKRLFKKITSYNKRVILYSHDAELFLNCVDNIYIINNEKIVYETKNIFDPTIYIEIDPPKIVDFLYQCEDLGVRLDEYTDINDLIKAIYRIKS